MNSAEKDVIGQETELKLLLMKEIDPDQVWNHPAIADFLAETPISEILVSTYFDTRDYRLLKNGLTYRIRKENKQWIATVKSMGSAAGGLHQREEWNMVLPDEKPRPEEFNEEAVRIKLLSLIDDQLLVPLLKTHFKRTKAIWKDHEHNEIEIALDQGEIITTVKSQPISEIELEIKHGKDQKVLLELGIVLSEQIPMIPGETSKFQRGLKLIGLKPSDKRSKRTKKRMPGKPENKTMGRMVPFILEIAFQDVMEYFYLLHQEKAGKEYVHQIRVKIRKLRALLSFFKPIIHADHYQMLKNELRDIAGQLTPLRELDVMKLHFDQFQKELKARNSNTSTDRLQRMLDRSLQKEREKINKTLFSGKLTPCALRILKQIHSFEMNAHAESILLSDFIPRRMEKWMDQFRAVSARSEIFDTAAMHRLRIQVKKIRYVTESMGSMIPHMTGKTINMLKELQDYLGELHDIQCERQRMKEWMTAELPDVILMTQAGIYEGWQQNREYQIRKDLQESWRRAIKIERKRNQ